MSPQKFIELVQSVMIIFPGVCSLDQIGFGDACDSEKKLFLEALKEFNYNPRYAWIRNEYYNSDNDTWTISSENIEVGEQCVTDFDDFGCRPLQWGDSDGEWILD